MVSLALPLFVVTMASQNLPGVAAIQAAGYSRARL
jgi:benzoate membrane transport protein